jgi:glycosidase
VLRSVIDVMRFWLDTGVDGLRLDAIPYLVEREGTINENLPETPCILKQLRAALDERHNQPHAARRGEPVAGRTCRPISAAATNATWPTTSR